MDWGTVAHVRLLQRKPIHPYLAFYQANVIPGDAHYAFHKMLAWIYRIVENNNIAAPDLLVGHNPIANASPVAQLVHQEVVADQQRVFHSLGRTLERLDGKGYAKLGSHQ